MKIVLKPMGVGVLAVALGALAVMALRKPPESTGDFAPISTATASVPVGGVAGAADKSAVVYDDALRGAWSSFGWAKTLDWQDKSLNHGSAPGASIHAVPKQNEAIYMHADKFDTTPYDRLSLWLYGGEKGGQILRVNMLLAGKNTADLTLKPLAAKKWTPVVLKLRDFGLDNKPNMTGFWLQNFDKSDVEVRIDDIRFLRPGEPDPTP